VPALPAGGLSSAMSEQATANAAQAVNATHAARRTHTIEMLIMGSRPSKRV
jgi:hypothetical protein